MARQSTMEAAVSGNDTNRGCTYVPTRAWCVATWIAAFATGCSAVHVFRYSDREYSPTEHVEQLQAFPRRPHTQIARMSVRKHTIDADRLFAMTARSLGADAFVIWTDVELGPDIPLGDFVALSGSEIWAVAIKYDTPGESALAASTAPTPAPAPSSSPCATCPAQCAKPKGECNAGDVMACYRLGACLCKCKLSAGGCGESLEALADCVAANTAKAGGAGSKGDE